MGGVCGGAVTDVERLAYHRAVRTYAPQLSIGAVRKTLKKRQVRRGGSRARRRRPEVQPGARRRRLHAVPVGQHSEWRTANPVPEPAGREHGYPRTELLKLARRCGRRRRRADWAVSVWCVEPEDAALRSSQGPALCGRDSP